MINEVHFEIASAAFLALLFFTDLFKRQLPIKKGDHFSGIALCDDVMQFFNSGLYSYDAVQYIYSAEYNYLYRYNDHWNFLCHGNTLACDVSDIPA